jgi:hypothetical protein
VLNLLIPVVFVACGTLVFSLLPNWRSARYVKKPDRGVWGFWHILDDSEWTQEGLELRRRYLVGIGVSLLVALGTGTLAHLLCRQV